jgi:ABC-type histidine transport system ATPase subunit
LGGDAEGGASFVSADLANPDRVVGFEVDVAALIARGLGRALVVATHDVDFARACAGRVVTIEDGHVTADGVVAEVLGA